MSIGDDGSRSKLDGPANVEGKNSNKKNEAENNCMNLIARLVSTIGWNDDMTRWHSTEHNRVEKERDIKTDATAERENSKRTVEAMNE